MTLRNVRFRYPYAEHDALAPVTMTVGVGEHVAVTGANGSGKTTLMLLLAGREPTSGTIERPGAVGMGKAGGTAVILQHPESQVLGSRVADDVVWGLPPGADVDVDHLLDEVGPDGHGRARHRRVVRRRAATARGGRRAGPRSRPADRRRGHVHGRPAGPRSTARGAVRADPAPTDVTGADHALQRRSRERRPRGRACRSRGQRLDGRNGRPRRPPRWLWDTSIRGCRCCELDGVGHEYASGTPWAKSALRDISFVVNEGDGVLIHGGNGSGKSTLAWIMAGLTHAHRGPLSGRRRARR